MDTMDKPEQFITPEEARAVGRNLLDNFVPRLRFAIQLSEKMLTGATDRLEELGEQLAVSIGDKVDALPLAEATYDLYKVLAAVHQSMGIIARGLIPKDSDGPDRNTDPRLS